MKRKEILLRIDPALHDALKRWAEEELRSLNGQIEYLLKQAVQRRGAKPTPPRKEGGAEQEGEQA